MLIRAVIISVLLHLAISLSPTRLELRAQPDKTGRQENALNVRLYPRSENKQSSPVPKKTRASEISPQTPVQSSSRSPRAAKVAQPDRSRMAPPAAKDAGATEAQASPQPDANVAELPPPSPEVLAQYRLNVALSARPFKVYPAQARESGWEGVVVVVLAMPMGAGYPTVSLGRSSGHQLLDDQALEMLNQAINLAVLPTGLRGKNLTISLPVEYRLSD